MDRSDGEGADHRKVCRRHGVQGMARSHVLADDQDVGAVEAFAPVQRIVRSSERQRQRAPVADGLLLRQCTVQPTAAGLVGVGEIEYEWTQIMVVRAAVCRLSHILAHHHRSIQRVAIHHANDGRPVMDRASEGVKSVEGAEGVLPRAGSAPLRAEDLEDLRQDFERLPRRCSKMVFLAPCWRSWTEAVLSYRPRLGTAAAVSRRSRRTVMEAIAVASPVKAIACHHERY